MTQTTIEDWQVQEAKNNFKYACWINATRYFMYSDEFKRYELRQRLKQEREQ
tara:strand:- start:3988 stop:4143 length:156 start_codon:yes stop_codon:yes gene_type:complete